MLSDREFWRQEEEKLDRLDSRLAQMMEERDRLLAEQTKNLEAEVARLKKQNKEMRDALEQCLEHFEDQYDCEIDSDGYHPNKAMQLGTMIDETLRGRP